jgi:hypothetical protein
MTRKLSLRFFILVSLIALASCGKKEEDMTPVQPGETVTYKDLVYRFSFKAPKSWVVESVPGRNTIYYSSPATETRFQKFTEGDFGARAGVGVIEHSSKEKAAEDFKTSMENINFAAPEATTLAGQPAIKVGYSITADEDGLAGYRIFTDKDSLVTYFDAATFGAKRMAKYAPVFDLAEKSVQPAFVLKVTNGKIDSASLNAMMEQMKPSQNFETYNGSGFSIQYPDNFHSSGSGGGVQIMGERQDAMVRVDANPVAKGIDLSKYVAENSKSAIYRGAVPQSATLSGQPAKVLSYGTSGATARTYFVMSGEKVFRITVSWPNELEAAFRPALEKSVQSFKLK